jgi:hypothetical protein
MPSLFIPRRGTWLGLLVVAGKLRGSSGAVAASTKHTAQHGSRGSGSGCSIAWQGIGSVLCSVCCGCARYAQAGPGLQLQVGTSIALLPWWVPALPRGRMSRGLDPPALEAGMVAARRPMATQDCSCTAPHRTAPRTEQAPHSTAQHSTAPHKTSTTQHRIALHHTVLYCTVLYCTAMY